jgi:hypothetical protein
VLSFRHKAKVALMFYPTLRFGKKRASDALLAGVRQDSEVVYGNMAIPVHAQLDTAYQFA